MTHRAQFDAPAQAGLVAAASSGNADAVAELYDVTFARVYAFALRIARNQQDAEDITSETYERALRSLRNYRSEESSLIVWLIDIARDVAHEHERETVHPATVVLTASDVEHLPDERAEGSLSRWDLDALTPAQREVVALRLAGFKIREIASSLGKAEGTVKALQFGAVRRLREVVRRD